MLTPSIQGSFTIINPEHTGPFIFSCEHASNQLPPNTPTTPEDKYFLQSHWGWDIGARRVTEGLALHLNSQAILAGVSRLWIDYNRSLNRTDLVRLNTEGHELTFNQSLSKSEIDQRIDEWYKPYHCAFDNLVAKRCLQPPSVILISIHSFTPVWDAQVRTMDIGVLFDLHSTESQLLATELASEGFFVACNEPYSGRGGLMYSVEDKGRRHNCLHLELEINQALICTPDRIERIVHRLSTVLHRWRTKQTNT